MSIKISETQTGGFTKTPKRSKEVEKGVSELAYGGTNENGFANHVGTCVALNDLAHEIFKDKTECAGLTNDNTPSVDTTEDINSPAHHSLL